MYSVDAPQSHFYLKRKGYCLDYDCRTKLNRVYWAKLEDHVRQPVDRNGKVTIVTRPLFIPEKRQDGRKFVQYEVVGENNAAVPIHYFKVIKLKNRSEAYLIPNQEVKSGIPLDKFKKTVKQIEKISGVVL